MPSTSPFGIWFPDDTSPISPIESLWAQQATSINTQFGAFQTLAPFEVANNTDRDLRFPTPNQGDRVYRLDLAREEQYLGTWNSTTNPGGATPAGWYPISGQLTCSLTLTGSMASSGSYPLLGQAGGAAGSWGELADPAGWHSPTTQPERITPNIPGAYRVLGSVHWASNNTGARIYHLMKNGTATQLSGDRKDNPNDLASMSIAYEVAMNGSTDGLNFRVLQNSGSTLGISGTFSVTWIAPLN